MRLDNSYRRTVLGALPVLALMLSIGCGSFHHYPIDEVSFKTRAETQEEGDVRATICVPSPEETLWLFGVPMEKKGIQPVWVEIHNGREERLFLARVVMDPMYFSPSEAVFRCKSGKSKEARREMVDHFYDLGMPNVIPPGETRSGFVYTTLDRGGKVVKVGLWGDDEAHDFLFIFSVPGIQADFTRVDFENLYSDEEIRTVGEAELRKALSEMPACTTNKKGKDPGDPLNLVLVGRGDWVFGALVMAGWDVTESITGGSFWWTMRSMLFRSTYRYSPVSSLYVFGRGQDAAFQKARETIRERNHLRLWKTPLLFEGEPVWIGQISRDIGVRFSKKTITTHAIDPDVDEERWYIAQDLIRSQTVRKLGWVEGVGAAPMHQPRHNLTGDPYFTDGHRVVLVLSPDPVTPEELTIFNWERPFADE